MREFKFRGFHNNEEMIYFGLGQYIPDGIIMQFTGVLDKNKKEVYEGDILEVSYYNYSSKNTKLIQEVYYSPENGCFCVRSVDKEVDSLMEDRNNVPLHWTNQPNVITIIGNIYEKL